MSFLMTRKNLRKESTKALKADVMAPTVMDLTTDIVTAPAMEDLTMVTDTEDLTTVQDTEDVEWAAWVPASAT